jgi:deoxycytidine triphosphate deaminase
MGVFTKPDFERAEKEGRFVVKNRLSFGTASVDIRVKKLFRQSRILLPPFDSPEKLIDVPTDRFLESLVEVPLQKEGHWLLKPEEFYLFLAEEEVYKRKEEYLKANIITRSSWARFGVRTQETDDKFTYANREFDDKLVISLKAWRLSIPDHCRRH